MTIFAIDDEPKALSLLHDAIAEAKPEAEILDFSDSNTVLTALKDQGQRPEVVFSDIELPGKTGLALAVEIKQVSPATKIIFVTGFPKYAADAFRLHASGYIVKPVFADRVREELDRLNLPARRVQTEKLRVRCFGHFEVFWKDRPLPFSRKKTKELLAFLVDREGAWCSSEEIIDALWEDKAQGKDKRHYLRVLTSELSAALKDIGQPGVLLRKRGQWAVDRELLDCDFYRMLAGDMEAVNAFHGEYMVDYSWAELTAGRLFFQVLK